MDLVDVDARRRRLQIASAPASGVLQAAIGIPPGSVRGILAAVTDEIPAFDLYAELEVSERATVETIQAAYRSLQLRHHPDLAGSAGGARSVRLNVAREWLTDPARRAAYDAHRADARRAEAAAVGDEFAAEPDPPDASLAGSAVDAAPAGTPPAARGDADTPGHGLANAVIALRLDIGRLVRLWLAGLGFLGGVGVTGGMAWPPPARVALAVAALVVLLALTTRRVRTEPGAGFATRAARTGWSLLGWAGIAALGVEGVAVASGTAGAGGETGGVAGPVLAATAVVSLTALRRRAGPVRASVDDFLAMTPAEFEAAVGEVLGRHGYRLRRTGGPGDLAADLTGVDGRGVATVVQCKRYAPGHPVGSRDVQLLIAMGVRHHGAERLVLVTTSDFTDPARDLAEQHGVELINGEDLEDLTR